MKFGKTKVVELPAGIEIKYTKTSEPKIKKFIVDHPNMVRINTNGTFTLLNNLSIDTTTLKLYKEYVTQEFNLIEAASKLGSKRATTYNSGSVLTQEGYTFMVNAFNEDISGQDLITFARNHSIPDERIPAFVVLYDKFVLALNLSLRPDYGSSEVNSMFQGVLSNNLTIKLLSLYKSLKYPKNSSGRYTTNNLLLGMNNAYDAAVNASNAKLEKLLRDVGSDRWPGFVMELDQLYRPKLSESETNDIASGHTKTARDAKKKVYVNRHKDASLLRLKQYIPSIVLSSGMKYAKEIADRTTSEEFTAQTFMMMAHSIVSAVDTNPLLKVKLNTADAKSAKELLKAEINANTLSFSDYNQTNAADIRATAFNLIQQQQYAIAAKFINAYISAFIDFFKQFVVKNSPQKVKRVKRRFDKSSLASILN